MPHITYAPGTRVWPHYAADEGKPCDLDGSQVITKSYPILGIDGGKGGYFSNPQMVERKSALFGGSRQGSVLEREAIILDHRISEHFAGDALDFGLGVFAGDAVVQRDLEVLALTQIVNAAIAHLLQGAVNGFALRIEHSFLERNVNVGFHRRIPIIQIPQWLPHLAI